MIIGAISCLHDYLCLKLFAQWTLILQAICKTKNNNSKINTSKLNQTYLLQCLCMVRFLGENACLFSSCQPFPALCPNQGLEDVCLPHRPKMSLLCLVHIGHERLNPLLYLQLPCWSTCKTLLGCGLPTKCFLLWLSFHFVNCNSCLFTLASPLVITFLNVRGPSAPRHHLYLFL